MRSSLLVATAFLLIAGMAAPAAGEQFYKQQDCGQFTVQMDMNVCANANLDAANAALNKIYQTVMRRQSSQESKDRLRNAERAWMAKRDKTCAEEVGPQEEGGSIWPLEMANCLQDQTDTRIRELKKLAN